MRKLGMNVIDPVLRIQYQPTDKDLEECKRLGKDLASKLKKTSEKHIKAGKIDTEVKMGEGGH